MFKADTLYFNGYIYFTAFKKFVYGYFSVKGDRILHLGAGEVPDDVKYENKTDLGGKYVIPGLIDCHMHIESSMITPKTFARVMVENGVTTVVSEPHEIANVKGLSGVLAMIEAGKGADMDIFYAIPSSVPSTDAEHETTGDAIDLDAVKELIKHKEVICLGEVMNTNGVLNNPQDRQLKFVNYLKENRPDMPLEGHVPRISGTDLNHYVYTGINSDHTDHGYDEFMHRMMNGVFYQIQYITAKEEIAKAIEEYSLYENVAIVTDDTPPSTLMEKGHLNRVIMYMTELGMKFENALYCATATPAKRMHLYDRGRLTPGMLADFCILENTDGIEPLQTYKNGKKVYDRAEVNSYAGCKGAFPKDFYETMKLGKLSESDFDFKADKPDGTYTVNGLQTVYESTRTPKFSEKAEIINGIVALPEDANKLFVFERHGKNGNVKAALAGGKCVVKGGAVATSYAHDHHNLVVLGDNNRDMAVAANTVIDNRGGFCVVSGGKVIAQCRLEVCGLMSERSPLEVAKDIEAVEEAMCSIGYESHDPIMSIGTMCLPVSMECKLTDMGLFDVPNSKYIPIVE